MKSNKLIVAAAGAGKTTFLVNQALKLKEERVLITTYTQANEAEIRKKIIELNHCIPQNVTVQTWFSFLLQHGVRPFQGGLFEKEITGLILVNSQSAVKFKTKTGIPICYKEDTEFENHYFTKSLKIYSDKLSKFVVKCNEKSGGAVIDRISRLYSNLFIDEVQDLAGYDLEFLKLLFLSKCNLFLVGDPRQVTYLTHNERKYGKYVNGLIKDFIHTECKKIPFEIDENTLNLSHRSNKQICDFSSKLYPNFPPCGSTQNKETNHDGVYLVRPNDVNEYLKDYQPTQLRLNIETKNISKDLPVYNFGESKGLSFDRVIIYPTVDMEKWLKNNNQPLADKTRAQYYVALTRARYSVAIICEYSDEMEISGIIKWK